MATLQVHTTALGPLFTCRKYVNIGQKAVMVSCLARSPLSSCQIFLLSQELCPTHTCVLLSALTFAAAIQIYC